MKNLRIGKKLTLTFGIIFLLFCSSVLLSVTSLRSNRTSFDNFYEEGYMLTNTVMDMRRAIQASAKYVGYSIMTMDEAEARSYYESMKQEAVVMSDGITYLKSHFKGDQALVRGFEDSMTAIQTDRDTVHDMAAKNMVAEATALYFNNVYPGYMSANDYLQQIYDDVKVTGENAYTSAITLIGRSVTVMFIVSVISIASMLLMAIYLTRNLTKPIKELEAAALEMSRGNLNVNLEYISMDEYGVLADSMRTLITKISGIISDLGFLLKEISAGHFDISSQAEDNYLGDFAPLLFSIQNITNRLSDALTQINESSEQVSSGSEQVSSGAQALSQGATEQASAIEELAASINEISEQVRSTADNARNADVLANLAGENMAVCDGQMREMITAMTDISNASGEISKIIKTIEDIAFQTNMLALNAAVEAARAGEAGKGFAVVADEVRNLASKSAEASKNTAALIEGSVSAVDKGTNLANATAETLLKVLQNANDVSTLVGKIAEAADHQATSIVQITQGIDQISSVVQTNSATAQESAASSEELSGQAQMLKGLVGRFRLKNSVPAHSQTYEYTSAATAETSSYRPDSMNKY